MRIVAGMAADELRDRNIRAARRPVRLEQLFHPRIVIRAVEDHDPRLRDVACGLRARLEQVRVLVGMGEDAGHRDMGAADLRGDVAIKILGRDDPHGIGEGGRGKGAERREAPERGGE